MNSTALDVLLFVREWNPGKSAQFMCASDRGNGKVHNKGSPQKTPAPRRRREKSSSSSASDGKVIKVEEPGSEDNDYSNTEDCAISAAAVASSDTVGVRPLP